MSRRADIDFTFENPITVSAIMRALSPTGWSPVEPLGVSFFIEDDGDIDWETGDAEDANFIIASLDAPDNTDKATGVSLYNESTGRGGTLLIFSGRTQVSFTPSIDRKSLHEDIPRMTDIAWYLNQLVFPLVHIGLSGYEARDLLD
ncbi:hypothetical protein GCM10012285_53920 [Streptomyces kronopolitis]|uniref:Uncharacterized protein n=1 Tax=Streptomyces kronopolitis TaxID=1612435 RepID=A0ABQ2JXV7_9ACTN|nr:hypothetical protein [Streptomyces kronopolitis]GGN58013.1 hypothetical protein GCM10012285_53920 [Streptomyces kronopolitis]